jgi:hypothetical protein
MSSGCPSAFDNTASNGNTAIGFAALFCVRYEQINAMLLNEFSQKSIAEARSKIARFRNKKRRLRS